MGYHLKIISAIRAMAINGEGDAIASLLDMFRSYPLEVNLDESMALKLRCVQFICHREISAQRPVRTALL